MITFLFGASITINIIFSIILFLIYKFGFSKFRRKLEMAENELLGIDNELFEGINVGDFK